ncbi:putative TRP C-terminal domain-containing protein [Seiridium cardinale]|uniref:TRP C-terminal domain-containing protein n=1 Tax=Seiridium cardinale TaxID=138064 RepID=A0ABR2Y6U0_9PEZI
MFTGAIKLWKDYAGTLSTDGFFWALRDVMSAFDNNTNDTGGDIILYTTHYSHLDCTNASIFFASIPTIWDYRLGVNMEDFQPRDVLSSAVSCVAGSCNDANCTVPVVSLGSGSNASDTVHNAWLSIHSVCENTEKWVADPDIIGPGVLISYMAQAVTGVLLWAVFASWSLTALAPQVEKIGPLLLSLFIPRARATLIFTRISQRLRTYHMRFNQANPTAILRLILVEFHEAQCFFIMSTQFAILIAHRFSNFSSNTLWFGFIQDENSAALLAVCGVLPTVLIQATLVRCQLNSFYTLVLSSTTLASSFAIRKATAPISDFNSISSDQLYQLFDGINTVVECGKRTSPRTFCGTIQDAQKYLPSGVSIHGYDFLSGLWICLILLFLLLLLWMDRLMQRDVVSYAAAFGAQIAIHRRISGLVMITETCVQVVLELITAAATILGFKIQAELFHYNESLWSIGQFVAVTIFAPVVYKWIILTTFRIKTEMPVSTVGPDSKADEHDIPLIDVSGTCPATTH